MKKFFHAFAMAWSMFCFIPCPMPTWDDDARPLTIVCLPLVGLVIGACWALLAFLLRIAGAENMLGAVLMAVLPFVLSGFIHVDGYMDCCDAIGSRRDIEERQRILKDSTVGSFAVVGIVILLLVMFASMASFDYSACLPALIFVPVASRCCSGIAVDVLAPIGHSQYAGSFQDASKRGQVCAIAVMLAAAVILAGVLGGWRCLIAVAATTLGSTLALASARKQLGGMSGDISGFGICTGETIGMAVLALVFSIVAM